MPPSSAPGSATASPSLARRGRRLSPTARRAELLAALEQELVDRGLGALSVPRVVARARVSQGLFYRYFSDLDDALAALAADALAPIATAAYALDLSGARTAADVEAVLLDYYRVLAAALAARPALLGELLVSALGARGPFGRRMAVFLGAMRGHIRELSAKHLGRPPFDRADPDIAAGALVGMVLGAVYDVVRSPGSFDPARWARELARYETKLICTPAARRRAAKEAHHDPRRS